MWCCSALSLEEDDREMSTDPDFWRDFYYEIIKTAVVLVCWLLLNAV